MKKRILVLAVLVCAFLSLGSLSILAAEQNSPIAPLTVTEASATPSELGVYWDVPQNEWYYNYVLFVSMHKIFNGYPDGSFCPNVEMTRAEVVRVLYAIEGEPEAKATDKYSDVPKNEWYAEEVAWASTVGVVSGYPDGTFRPQLSVSRQDFVSMLYRYAQYKKFDISKKAELNFPDKGDINDYAVTPFAWAVQQNIINGDKEDNGVYLRPQNSSTRGQVGKMLSEFAVSYLKLGATTEVTLTTDNTTLTEGCSRLLKYTVLPKETAYPEMTWISSNPEIVSVSRGVITGVSAGEATITATTFDGHKATCKVTVTKAPANAYRDVTDFLTLHYNAGQWNIDPSYLVDGVDGDWRYFYGVTLNPPTGNLIFCSDSYSSNDGIDIYTEILADKSAKEFTCTIELYDEMEDVTFYGEATLDPAAWGKTSSVTLKTFSCDVPEFAIDEMKAFLTEALNEDIHFLVSSMDSLFQEMKLKSTMKDLGFTHYN